MKEEHSRTAALLGEENLDKLLRARVIVFGLGGVGSYVVEALARAGVDTLTLVDGVPVIAGHYPEDAELIDWLELPPEVLGYEFADEEDSADAAQDGDVPCPCGCGKPKSKHGFFWM